MRSLASVGLVLLLLSDCGGGERAGPSASVAATAMRYAGYDATGLASWYGEEVAGNATASGETFVPDGFTVAHRTLALGSVVEVTALDTGRSILARVTDRGPGRLDREIDLSRGAARLLGTNRHSLSAVRVRSVVPSVADGLTLSRGGPVVSVAGRSTLTSAPRMLPEDGRYLIQVASYSSARRARVVAAVVQAGVVPADAVFRVRLGPFDGADAAQQARDAVVARGYGDAEILPVN